MVCRRCWCCASRAALRSPFSSSAVSWIRGMGVFMAIDSSQARGQHEIAHRILLVCTIVNGKWYYDLRALKLASIGEGEGQGSARPHRHLLVDVPEGPVRGERKRGQGITSAGQRGGRGRP